MPKHNGRPKVAVSSLPPNEVSMVAGEQMQAVCMFCGRWRQVNRKMLWPHRAYDGVTRCPGSGQRLLVDLTAGEWAERLADARRSVLRAAGPEASIRHARHLVRTGRWPAGQRVIIGQS